MAPKMTENNHKQMKTFLKETKEEAKAGPLPATWKSIKPLCRTMEINPLGINI